ncbi:hypothetical protein ACWGJ2_02190 [Streptomyces sp. NPDC054796]
MSGDSGSDGARGLRGSCPLRAYERAVGRLAGWLEGVGPEFRQEVALTARELGSGARARDRCGELAALCGLVLRTRSRHRTGGAASLVWRQGVHLGAVLLLVAAAARIWADRPAPTPALVVSAVALALAGACALGVPGAPGPVGVAGRVVAVLLAGAGATGALAAGADGVGGACAVAVAGLCAGMPPPVRARWGSAVAVALAPCAGRPLALAVGSEAAGAAVSVALTVVVPAVLLVLGWYDPRLAAMGASVWCARLVVSDLGALGEALAAPLGAERRVLLLRWLLMGSGLVLAWLVTRRSIRESVRL